MLRLLRSPLLLPSWFEFELGYAVEGALESWRDPRVDEWRCVCRATFVAASAAAGGGKFPCAECGAPVTERVPFVDRFVSVLHDGMLDAPEQEELGARMRAERSRLAAALETYVGGREPRETDPIAEALDVFFSPPDPLALPWNVHRALTAVLVGVFELFEGRATDEADHPQDALSFLLERFAEKHDVPELASRARALLQHDPTFAEDHLLDWYTDPAGCQRWRSLPQFLGERRLMHRLEIEPGDDAPVLP